MKITTEIIKDYIKKKLPVPTELFIQVSKEYEEKLKEHEEEKQNNKHKILPICFKENKEALKVTQFPAGEPNIEIDFNWLLSRNNVTLEVIFPYNPIVLEVMYAVLGILKNNNIKVSLEIPYMPYARADRGIQKGDMLRMEMIQTFLDRLINNYGSIIKHIYTCSIHCEELYALNLFEKYNGILTNLEEMFDDFDFSNYDYIIFPDRGMDNRFIRNYMSDARDDGIDIRKIVEFKKERTDNGVKIVVNDKNINRCSDINLLKDKKCIIVDDIIDGGATIEELAKELSMCKELDVYTVHGLFSSPKGMNLEGIRKVFCKYNYLDYK